MFDRHGSKSSTAVLKPNSVFRDLIAGMKIENREAVSKRSAEEKREDFSSDSSSSSSSDSSDSEPEDVEPKNDLKSKINLT